MTEFGVKVLSSENGNFQSKFTSEISGTLQSNSEDSTKVVKQTLSTKLSTTSNSPSLSLSHGIVRRTMKTLRKSLTEMDQEDKSFDLSPTTESGEN